MHQAESLICAHDCPGNQTRRYPIVCMVAQGRLRGDHEPVRLVCFAPICKFCRRQVAVQDYLPPATRAAITAELDAHGKAPADFEHAWLEFGHVGDQHWREATAPDGETVQ